MEKEPLTTGNAQKNSNKTQKNEIDRGQLIEEETLTGAEVNRKEEKTKQDFPWALGPETNHQITRSEYRNEPDKVNSDKLIKSYNRHYLPKRNKYNSSEDFFRRNNQTRKTEIDH